ncbi:U-box domain-containing protein 14 [Tanacetum coccineum]
MFAAISFLDKTLKSLAKGNINSQVAQDCFHALYNLSILPANVAPMIEIDDFVSFLLTSMGDMEVSDRILSLLSNVVLTPDDHKALSGVCRILEIITQSNN